MSGISVDVEIRVFQTKQTSGAKIYTPKGAQNTLPFGKQRSSGTEAEHMETAAVLVKNHWHDSVGWKCMRLI